MSTDCHCGYPIDAERGWCAVYGNTHPERRTPTALMLRADKEAAPPEPVHHALTKRKPIAYSESLALRAYLAATGHHPACTSTNWTLT